eukprot:580704-Amphidinium_carterae.1
MDTRRADASFRRHFIIQCDQGRTLADYVGSSISTADRDTQCEDTQWQCFMWWFAGQWWCWEVLPYDATISVLHTRLYSDRQASSPWTGHGVSEFGSIHVGLNPNQVAIDSSLACSLLRRVQYRKCCIFHVRGGSVLSLTEERRQRWGSLFCVKRS